ncbi:MAG: hypothetical protein EPN23_10330 [Verrucomicrobia bacterium]|nr:MAG: hypothetical protein EPN23_10330 [Verrucomicrobiota bacterium]
METGAAGQRATMVLANGAGSSYAYDAAGQMTALQDTVGGAAFAQETY